ncbi:FHA domain-containing protein [Pseudoponticoccus marisrubri]|uniref:FHA domain-containing protein n=1 Tax=Pseudoponticoccus marisrubri TaxID=1685382 RepID=A0A0W7WKQ2_9RHOB|nr:FHA domain-containing protein [Pseudoponticoccus marisrubri]KUF11095.1 hypothetical protein AVJ23_08535 [Pseudoponticoccus marisrubri]
MSSFRSIIARRRPAPQDSAPAPETEEETVPPLDELLSAADRPAHTRLLDAPPPPPELPRWELEPPRPTMGEAQLKAPAEEPDPTPAARIWDLAPDSDPVPRVAPDMSFEPDAPMPRADMPDEPPLRTPATDPVRHVPDMPAEPAPALQTRMPAAARGGRVKTRLLGFHADDEGPGVFDGTPAPAARLDVTCPVGWVVIVDGPGRGTCFALSAGLSTLGRDASQTIALDFGDDCISRDTHASIAYDEEENSILIGHGGKSNLVRVNGKPLVSSAELHSGDEFRIGKTTCRFVALCGPDFSWTTPDDGPGDRA